MTAMRMQRASGKRRLANVGLQVLTIAVLLQLAVAASTTMAEPLPAETCEQFKSEHASLEAAGIPETLKKGPDWARANLPAAKLEEVRRYIGLEEQLLFRCGLALARGMPGSEPDEAEAGAVTGEAETPPPLPQRKPTKRDKKTSAAAPNASAAAAKKATTAPVRAPKPQPQTKRSPRAPKAKVDDAYRPPPAPSPPFAPAPAAPKQ